jgi:hypothetical protein
MSVKCPWFMETDINSGTEMKGCRAAAAMVATRLPSPPEITRYHIATRPWPPT